MDDLVFLCGTINEEGNAVALIVKAPDREAAARQFCMRFPGERVPWHGPLWIYRLPSESHGLITIDLNFFFSLGEGLNENPDGVESD